MEEKRTEGVGAWLRETRQQRGLSLAEVEEATRIRRKFLQALEDEDFDALPAEVHVRGFLRLYAQFLGLDPEEVLSRYEGKTAQPEEPVMAKVQPPAERARSTLFRPVDIPFAVEPAPPRRVSPRVIVISAVILALLIVGAWGAWTYGLPLLTRQPEATATVTVTPSATSVALATDTPLPPTFTPTAPAVLILPTPTPWPTPTPRLIPTPTAMTARRIVLEMTVVERAWVQVRVDGEIAFEGILEAGEERRWVARGHMALRCGNAGGVELTVNGEPLGRLGERGEVVDLEWRTREELPGVTVSPRVTATITVTATFTITPTATITAVTAPLTTTPTAVVTTTVTVTP